MEKKNNETNQQKTSKSLTRKQKKVIGGGVTFVVVAGALLVAGLSKDSTPEPADKQPNKDHHVLLGTKENDPYEDDRGEMADETLEVTLEQAKTLMAEGQWGDMVSLLEPLDKEYNLEESEAGRKVQSLLLDANGLVRLTSMGDTTDMVEEAVKRLPNMRNAEMFVLGLYYLPRNVLLEMSDDVLALASTQRGYVDLVERKDLPLTKEDGWKNEEVDEHEAIQSFYRRERGDNTEDGFIRFDVQNGPIEEYVYVAQNTDGTFGLVGIYSDDDNPANSTRTVDHHLKFRGDVQAGIEELMKREGLLESEDWSDNEGDSQEDVEDENEVDSEETEEDAE